MFSDNDRYLSFCGYTVTVIDPDPSSDIHQILMKSNDVYRANFDRVYVSDNLNHWTFDVVLLRYDDIEEDNNG